jgi:hypothetical protein
MPNGSFNIEHVRKIVVGKIMDPNKEFLKYYFRSIRIETEEGSVEILMESRSDTALRMESEGSVFQQLKKQVTG